jgi:hypothetical protein
MKSMKNILLAAAAGTAFALSGMAYAPRLKKI